MKFAFKILVLVMLRSTLMGQTDNVFIGKSPTDQDTSKVKKTKNTQWKKNFNVSGNFQLQFGTYTFVYLSPTIGYTFFKKLNLGVGGIYNYLSFGGSPSYGKFSQSVFGLHTAVRYFINSGLFAQVQFDKLRQPNLISYIPDQKVWVDYVMVGGGARQPLGDRTALTATLLYNLIPNPLSIYPNRLILQIGFIGYL